MSQIIIVYHQHDTEYTAYQLSSYLNQRFGYGSVTLGTRKFVQVGEDYKEAIANRVSQSEILLVLIGQRWLEGGWITDSNNLDRLAISTAIANKKRVLPILVNGTPMPTAGELPEDLLPLLNRKPLKLTDQAFDVAAGRLAEALDDFIRPIAASTAVTGSVLHKDKRALSAQSGGPYEQNWENNWTDGEIPYKKKWKNNWTETGVSDELAGAGVRLVAYLIDTVIVAIIAGVLGFIFGSSIGSSMQIRTYADLIAAQQTLETMGSIIGLVVYFIYYIVFWTNSGQTPGKQVMGIQVIHRDGRLLTTGEAIFRLIGYYISGLVLCIGYLWIFFDDKKRGWHDFMAGSLVVRAEKRKR